jgi:hypothetical protein
MLFLLLCQTKLIIKVLKILYLIQICSRTPFIWMLVIWIANYLEWLGPSGKSDENSTKLTCLEITNYEMKCSSVMASRTLIRQG